MMRTKAHKYPQFSNALEEERITFILCGFIYSKKTVDTHKTYGLGTANDPDAR